MLYSLANNGLCAMWRNERRTVRALAIAFVVGLYASRITSAVLPCWYTASRVAASPVYTPHLSSITASIFYILSSGRVRRTLCALPPSLHAQHVSPGAIKKRGDVSGAVKPLMPRERVRGGPLHMVNKTLSRRAYRASWRA